MPIATVMSSWIQRSHQSMSRIRRFVILVIIGLSALVVLDSVKAEECSQSEAAAFSYCKFLGY